MLIFIEKKLVYLATPKTGTTAVEMALRTEADISIGRSRKHMTAQRYRRKIAPFLKEAFQVEPDTVAVMRDPVEQLRSWYKYRTRAEKIGSARSTNGCSFDDFVLAVIADDPPAFAGIGSQFKFLTTRDGDLLVQHLFAYENQPQFRAFLSGRLDRDLTLKQINVSPEVPTPLSAETEQKLRAARSAEFALYDRLQQSGGHLETPLS
ncbi:MAG: hypothetical protein WBC93_17870 [Sulfitobacter sp.]